MLKLSSLSKTYNVNNSNFYALNNINVEFNKNEFVSIVGPSGCGKTTLLNIIGGLDKASAGTLEINGENTNGYKEWQWDLYRNKFIGFVFQSYNLISHITILKNVEMALTLSGVSAKLRKQKAIAALERVGLSEQVNKLPNQLSGGQKQRVAIARALVNNPKIILADEPTGALDSKSSVQIMELLKEISADRLVIMVSHNPELANKYSTRIVQMLDGKIVKDEELNKTKGTKLKKPAKKETEEKEELSKESAKSTKMSYFTAHKLSFSNLLTKKGRTIITSIASSIGIVGVALVLFLSNGFSYILNKYETDVFSQIPIAIAKTAQSVNMNHMQGDFDTSFEDKPVIYPPKDNPVFNTITNNITQDYINYVNNLNSELYTMFSNTYANMQFVAKNDDNHTLISPISDVASGKISSNILNILTDNSDYIKQNYDILAGDIVKNPDEAVLIVNSNNVLPKQVFNVLGVPENEEGVAFSQFIGKTFSMVEYDDVFTKIGTKFMPKFNVSQNVYSKHVVKVVGVIRIKENVNVLSFSNGIYITEVARSNYMLKNETSEIAVAQKADKDNCVLAGVQFGTGENALVTYESVCTLLGVNKLPVAISIYPKNAKAKDEIKKYLDVWNNEIAETEEDKVVYTDMASSVVEMLTQMSSMVSIVLIVFASISLVVSTVMISIITYISVIERTKEIGILKSLGARKKDITRVFKAESSIIGLLAGIIGVVVSILLCFPINSLLTKIMSTLSGAMRPSFLYSLILILVSIFLTYISALIPARMASKRNAVEALRTE